jgi:hypothetical protein
MIPGQEHCVRCNEYMDVPELCLCEVCSDDFYNEYDREGQELRAEHRHLRLQHAQLRQAVRRTISWHETAGTSWYVLKYSLEAQGIEPESLQLTDAELERWSEADRLRSALEEIAFEGCFGNHPGNVSCDAPEIVKRCYPCRARAALARTRSG